MTREQPINPYIFSIIKRLADGQFHSGEAIAKHFRVSRATIWNAIQAAEMLGITIFSVRGRGYKLPQAVTLLDQFTIKNLLAKQQNQIAVEIHDVLGSTNSHLMQRLSTIHDDQMCVATNLQRDGRGRRGRAWQAGLGESLTFSLLWRFQCGAGSLSGLSLVVGVAIIRALNHLGINTVQLKWPNDIVVHTPATDTVEKLAGILIELQGDMEGPSAAVIGIGINLTLSTHLKAAIDQPATDISQLITAKVDPNELLAQILIALDTTLSTFEESGFAAFKEEWLSYHAYADKTVKMIMPDGSTSTGTVTDIADDGALLLSTSAGVKRFAAGEISLRGV